MCLRLKADFGFLGREEREGSLRAEVLIEFFTISILYHKKEKSGRSVCYNKINK